MGGPQQQATALFYQFKCMDSSHFERFLNPQNILYDVTILASSDVSARQGILPTGAANVSQRPTSHECYDKPQ